MAKIPIKKKMYRFHIHSLSAVLIFIITLQSAHTSPVIRSSRMVREIYPEVEQEIPDSSQTQVCIVGDVVYGAGESVPSEQPCLKCACAPPDVRCETEICVQQPGCKAIHRSNKCCPDYQCECQHEGKTYGNGERLPSAPGGECLVCYCRGGEVQCAEVGCYTRSDCEPRYVTGQCCPKYDHCPPRDPTSDRVQFTTESTLSNVEPELISSWPLTSIPENATVPETNEEGSGEYESPVSADDFPSVIPMQTTPNSMQSDEPNPRPATPITFSIKEIESKTNSKRNDEKVKVITKVDKATQTDSEGRPQITIQEVIPARTEFKITSSPLKDIPPKAVSISPINPVTFKNEDTGVSTSSPVKILTDTSNELTDSESYASEKTEVYDHPPPVLRIGDQLLFIKQGQLVPEKDASTPTPVITLIGAEGLQIGLGSGELLEHEIIPINHEESSSTAETSISTNPTGKKLEEIDVPHDVSTKNSIEDLVSSAENEPASDGTTTVSAPKVEIISSEDSSEANETYLKNGPSVILEQNDTSNEFITVSSADLANKSSHQPDQSSKEGEIISTTVAPENDKSNSSVPTVEPAQFKSDNSEYIPEENPYYPPIPEDIMILGQDEPTTDVTSETSLHSSTSKNQNDPEVNMTRPSALSNSAKASDQQNLKGDKNRENKEILSPVTVSSEKNVDEAPKPLDIPSNKQQMDVQTISSVEEKENKDINLRILPDILEIRSNKTVESSQNGSSPSWLKSETPTKIIIPLTKDLNYNIPLINEKAVLPDSLLEMTAPSDLITELDDLIDVSTHSPPVSSDLPLKVNSTTTLPAESAVTDIIADDTSVQPLREDSSVVGITVVKKSDDGRKSEKIMAAKASDDDSKSKETLEVNEENFDSGESTTNSSQHPSLLSSNEDASVEVIQNDSAASDPSDLVEMIPGFEKVTQRVPTSKEHSEESLKASEVGDSPKNDVDQSEEKSESGDSPKNDVEIITENVDKIVTEDDSHVEMKDFHEEIQKRDVVKKVLKDTFENPKENIRTDLVEDSSLEFSTENAFNEEQNAVKPNDNNHDLTTRSLNSNSSKVNAQNEKNDINKLKEESSTIKNLPDKEMQVIQKVNTDHTKMNLQESAESLDTGALGVLRDFFKSQFRQYHNSRLTD